MPLTKGQDPRDTTLTGITWVLGDTAELANVLIGELAVNSWWATPPRPAPRPGTIATWSRRQWQRLPRYLRNGMFSAELQGMEVDKQDRLRAVVTECLETVAQDGFSQDQIDSALHQLELRRRHRGRWHALWS